MSLLTGVSGLELVEYRDERGGAITVQLALNGKLSVPMTVEREIFWSFAETERHKWLARCARTLLDIFGDARDGLRLSDAEVERRAAAA